ncbi:MAG: RICIN domain-containing protein [Reinekea sp.]|jgi:hypothetical protein
MNFKELLRHPLTYSVLMSVTLSACNDVGITVSQPGSVDQADSSGTDSSSSGDTDSSNTPSQPIDGDSATDTTVPPDNTSQPGNNSDSTNTDNSTPPPSPEPPAADGSSGNSSDNAGNQNGDPATPDPDQGADSAVVERVIQENNSGFCRVDGTIDNNNSGFTGDGFINTDNAKGKAAYWKVKAAATNYLLSWRYANGGGAERSAAVYVNDQPVATVQFPSTGAWNQWSEGIVNIPLVAGENVIRLQAQTDAGLANIDALTLTGDALETVNCEDQALTRILDDGRYVIYARHSGMALDVAGGSQDDSANIQQWGYGGGEWQQFDVAYQGGGYYSLRAAHSGKAITLYSDNVESGGEVVQWAWTGSDAQLWRLEQAGSNYFTVTSRLSGLNFDIWQKSQDAGGDLRQYAPGNSTNQQFQFATVADNGGGSDKNPPTNNGPVLAFPGAQGFGRFATGGRGGEVVHVTNLNDSGAGSLRDAISKSNRIVVFDVGGVIKLNSRLVFKNNQTIAGQTAPGGGITIYGDGTSFSGASNTIVRYLRFRMGRYGAYGKDTVTAANGHDIIWDHCSLSWGRDANFDLNVSSGRDLYNLTLQDSIVAQGLQSHSTGGIAQTTGTSIIRSLYIDNNSRNPKARGTLQFVNNVVYNWVVSGYILGDTSGRSDGAMIGNYFIAGPESKGGTLKSPTPSYHIYAQDNWYDSNKDGSLNGRLLGEGDFGSVTWHTTPSAEFPDVPTLSAEQALQHVIDHAGASYWRDDADNYVIDELKSWGRQGKTISDERSLGLPNVVGNIPGGSAPTDSDRDGMPDSWEAANGLNPNDASDAMADQDSDGWVNIEEYVNGLVQ